MFIMTANGWKPLVSFADANAASQQLIDDAEQGVVEARKLSFGSDVSNEQRRANHDNFMKAFRNYGNAVEAYRSH